MQQEEKTTVEIRVKCSRYPDFLTLIPIDKKVIDLKKLLEECYPHHHFKPLANSQKLIFSGEILKDDQMLEHLFKKKKSDLSHTQFFHLVISSPSPPSECVQNSGNDNNNEEKKKLLLSMEFFLFHNSYNYNPKNREKIICNNFINEMYAKAYFSTMFFSSNQIDYVKSILKVIEQAEKLSNSDSNSSSDFTFLKLCYIDICNFLELNTKQINRPNNNNNNTKDIIMGDTHNTTNNTTNVNNTTTTKVIMDDDNDMHDDDNDDMHDDDNDDDMHGGDDDNNNNNTIRMICQKMLKEALRDAKQWSLFSSDLTMPVAKNGKQFSKYVSYLLKQKESFLCGILKAKYNNNKKLKITISHFDSRYFLFKLLFVNNIRSQCSQCSTRDLENTFLASLSKAIGLEQLFMYPHMKMDLSVKDLVSLRKEFTISKLGYLR